MPTIIYKGLTKSQREDALEAAMSVARPPEERGEKEKRLNIEKRDNDQVKERKRDNIKKWRADFREQLKRSIEARDAFKVVFGMKFEKDKPTRVPENHELCRNAIDPKEKTRTGPSKLDCMVKSGEFELVTEKPKIKETQ